MYDQDDPAEYFYVLLDGEIQLVKRLDGTDVVLTTANQPGAYAGATRAFIGSSGDESYASSLRTVTRTRLFKLRAEDFAYVLQDLVPDGRPPARRDVPRYVQCRSPRRASGTS